MITQSTMALLPVVESTLGAMLAPDVNAAFE
jgi:hypothetical protein